MNQQIMIKQAFMEQAKGNIHGAIELLLQISPQSAEVKNNLGLLYQSIGDNNKAILFFEQAWNLKPQVIAICINFVNALLVNSLFDKAIEVLLHESALYPQNADIFNGIGNIYIKKDDLAKAREYYVKALQIKPDFGEVHFNVGLIMREWNRLDEAITCFTNAIKFDSSLFYAYLNLGEAYQILGEIDKSEDVFRRALQFDSQNEIVHDNLLLSINYNNRYSGDQVIEKHLEWGRRKATAIRDFANSKDPLKRLKIGYVSPDYCKHPAAQFFECLFKFHSDEFEIFNYAQIRFRDERMNYFKNQSSHWIETQDMTDEILFRQIQSDGIDILVDCAGHMSGNRLGVSAMRPAPIQVSGFGYPCTTGVSTIDFRISDFITDPTDEISHHREKLLRMDHSFCCYSPDENAPDIGPLPCKENGCLTFGSLHTTARLNEEVIELWAQVLLNIPYARLMIFRTTLCTSVIEKIKKIIEKTGVDIRKIDFLNTPPTDGYLSIYNRIDCQLDTFPWSGHTTACESLWMGVPVLTLYGDRHAGRMVCSVLKSCGMEQWIAYSKDEYIQKAKLFTENFSGLENLRGQLRKKLSDSTLCNGSMYTKNLEAQYRKIWQEFCDA